MSEALIPVDLANPGQVFACIGFVEAADTLLGEASGGFDWRNGDTAHFHLKAAGEENPAARVLRFLDRASVASLAPSGSANSTAKWEVDTLRCDSNEFPFKDPQSPATLPTLIKDSSGNAIVIDHWGDETRRDNVKFWAGSGGYPGAGLVRDALGLIAQRAEDNVDDPFAFAVEQSSSFRFDWRRDYVPIDAGFSPNAHGNNVKMRGHPIVELLAAIGLTHARPKRHDKLTYTYGVAGLRDIEPYDPMFLRVALGTQHPPFPGMPFRMFRMRLNWPGQENQARCITDVVEETVE